ncbi:terminase [Paraburkholderia sp. BL21I4N1]|uniref:terminase small subunit-like protein n=1 Tax=Paraburkholderia sp. BL21I4N1 TaxID=1938801 RepID=UPI000CFD426F|nr:terminase [Paraburkholderia sp. BL21I4N1]PQV51852.1 hypothetical protein B0G83_10461 [Paraburkholderia sp. BL21I4N1]
MAQESTYTPELADEICERIANGETLREITREPHMPSYRSVYRWREAYPQFASRFAHARDCGFDVIAEETVEILDTPPERCATEHGDKVDAGYVQWQRNRADQRLKLLAKWSPRYSERIDVTSNGQTLALTPEERAAKLASIAEQAARRKAEQEDGSDLL